MKQRMTYTEQLNHPLWKQKASFIRERDDFKCVLCGAEWKELHIHHKSPEPFKLAWEYPDEMLETLCEDCHAWETMYQRIFFRLTGDQFFWFGQSAEDVTEYYRIKALPKKEAIALFESWVRKNPMNDEALLLKLKSSLQQEIESKPLLTNHS